jgi:F-box protein, helicase, 18
MSAFEPTQEQRLIASHQFSPGEILKIVAYAGTGKTTTLEYLARTIEERNPTQTILYLAFNKSVAAEAKQRFPTNVEARTIHSVAYKNIAGPYRHKLEGDLRARLIAQKWGSSDLSGIKAGCDTVRKFFSCEDQKINSTHVPEDYEGTKRGAIEWAERLWDSMTDPDDESVPMIHDGYLKLFHLENPELGFDYIFLDEAQDSNPVTTDIVMGQKNAVKVLVGDPHQQIYSWRGAKNAMKSIKGTSTQYLTGSFRFGQQVASIANLLLLYYKKEDKGVRGLRKTGEVGLINSSKPYTILGRTNSAIFEEALSLHQAGIKIAVVGGEDGLKANQLKDAFRLLTKQNNYIRDEYMKTFDSFETLENYGKEYEDPEAKSLCRTIRKNSEGFNVLLEDLLESLVEEDEAHVILSTAHKAKGLEWDQVKLLDDFVDFFNEQGELLHPHYHEPDEINLMYVAVTRAQKVLQINETLKNAVFKIRESIKAAS